MARYFSDDNDIMDKVLQLCELPSLVARKLIVPIPIEGYYGRALVALSLVLSPVWFGVYLWNEHEMNLFWLNGVPYIGITVVICIVMGAFIVRYAPGGSDGVMTLLISTPIALYGFVIAAPWIDFISEKLVSLLEFLGIICRVPSPIMAVLAWA